MAQNVSTNVSSVPQNVTSESTSHPWTSITETTQWNGTHSVNPDNGIVSHHRDLMDWSMLHPDYQDNRELLDRPLMGIAIIGGFFLTISLLLVVAVIVFYLKRNTVFVLEKSVHGGLYQPGDQSLVIGQTALARNMGRRTARSNDWHSGEPDSVNGLDGTEADDTDSDTQFDYDDANTDANTNEHRSRPISFDQLTPSGRPVLGSYVIRPDHLVFTNPQHRKHSATCSHSIAHNNANRSRSYLCPHGKPSPPFYSTTPSSAQDTCPGLESQLHLETNQTPQSGSQMNTVHAHQSQSTDRQSLAQSGDEKKQPSPPPRLNRSLVNSNSMSSTSSDKENIQEKQHPEPHLLDSICENEEGPQSECSLSVDQKPLIDHVSAVFVQTHPGTTHPPDSTPSF
ncbi:unnamed protein product [Echinostoma caproni]|uniref:APP_amyloid domain-containing protein n=1 Tax=Echinostoma caproni TaxID=27848 RepID=A0A183AQP4_9TREM|nr:unnamed protein product [Echinostoma caproni]